MKRSTLLRVAMTSVVASLAAMTLACEDSGTSNMAPISASAAPAGTAAPTKTSGQLLLASTTTTQDSGLLDVLIPAFEQETGYTVKLVAGGSGQAIENGTRVLSQRAQAGLPPQRASIQ